MPRLASVPDSPPRAIAYIRVSTSREDMVSPELQLTAIEDHCSRAGYVLVETIQDLDLSGRFWKRRQVERAIAMIEAGDADVLVTWKWSRVSRNRLDWAIAVDRVESAGGKLDSATEPIDTSTSAGRLQRGMLAEFAAFESDRIGDVWREVHARRTKRGLPTSGRPRFGYRYVDGLHRPDPETGPVLADLYRRYIAGESMYSLVGWLNQHGITTVAGYRKEGPGPWSQVRLRKVLDAGFGAGFLMVRGERHRGVHEPVIDDGTWAAYQAMRAARRPLSRSERSQYVLSGLVRCAYPMDDGSTCESPMTGGRFGRDQRPMFRCVNALSYRSHPRGYVTMRLVEDEVLAWLGRIAGEVSEGVDATVAQQARSARRRQDSKALHRHLLRLDKSLTQLAVNQSDPGMAMPDDIYRAARDELLAKRAGLEERIRVADAESVDFVPSTVAADLLAEWDEVPVEHRRGTLRRLIARVEIRPEPGPAGARYAIEVVPTFRG